MSRKLSPFEIETLHSDVATFVQDHWQDAANENICISPYVESDVGLEALVCTLTGVTTTRLFFKRADLRDRFPGSDLYVEFTPNGTAYLRLEIPIYVEETFSIIKGSQKRYVRRNEAGEPSMTTGLALFASSVVLDVIVYFRLMGAT